MTIMAIVTIMTTTSAYLGILLLSDIPCHSSNDGRMAHAYIASTWDAVVRVS